MKTSLRLTVLAACGLAAGVVNGLLGAGSGVVLVYALRAVLGGQTDDTRDIFANATAVILPISLVSAVGYALSGSLPPAEVTARYLLPGAAGGLAGAYLLGRLPAGAVRRIFCGVVFVSGLLMIIR